MVNIGVIKNKRNTVYRAPLDALDTPHQHVSVWREPNTFFNVLKKREKKHICIKPPGFLRVFCIVPSTLLTP
jgi:hypothetical protein